MPDIIRLNYIHEHCRVDLSGWEINNQSLTWVSIELPGQRSWKSEFLIKRSIWTLGYFVYLLFKILSIITPPLISVSRLDEMLQVSHIILDITVNNLNEVSSSKGEKEWQASLLPLRLFPPIPTISYKFSVSLLKNTLCLSYKYSVSFLQILFSLPLPDNFRRS